MVVPSIQQQLAERICLPEFLEDIPYPKECTLGPIKDLD